MASNGIPTSTSTKHRSCADIVTAARMRSHERRAQRAKQPWITLKLAVGIAGAIIAYACYVYIGRLCVPMIKRNGSGDALGGRGIGVAFLVVFILLGFMLVWAYIKVVFAPPGFAKDHVTSTSPPTPSFSYSYSYRGAPAPLDPSSPNVADATHDDAETETIGIPYAATRPHASHLPAVIVDAYDLNYSSVDRRRAREAALPTLNTGAGHGAPLVQPEPSISASPSAEPEHETEEGGTASSSATPSPAIAFAPPESPSSSASTSHTPFSSHDTPASPSAHAEKRSRASRHPAHPHSQWHTPGAGHRDQDQDRKRYKGRERQASNQGAERERYGDVGTEHKRGRGRNGNGEKREGFSMTATRRPPGTPVLAEEFRYCRRCNFVRPPRAHHCRACGTCVLKYDHHCPWVGQCVGAQNHKFFVDLVFWALLFCLWTFSTLVGLNARASAVRGMNVSVDPQHIVVIALAGLFALFTAIMLITHVTLISGNYTTVEHMSMRTMKEKERDMLSQIHPIWAISAKKRTVREWDREWGRMETEGNLWYLGSVRRHWELVMGTNAWTWFLPVGRGTSDGVTFERNPRFDAKGRWMPRREWPAELQ